MNAKLPKTEELLALVHEWARPLVEHQAFRSLSRSKIKSALDWVDGFRGGGVSVSEVVLPPKLQEQHDVVMQFYYLRGAYERLAQVEFYFRRYPFKARDITKYEHLENVCTMFFSAFYIFEERMEKYINALNKVADRQIKIGPILRMYRKEFRDELQERHGATHFAPFDDTTVQAVLLRTLLMKDFEPRGPDQRELDYVYRKASRNWAQLARARAGAVGRFLEAIAGATLDVGSFLKNPPVAGPDDLIAVLRK